MAESQATGVRLNKKGNPSIIHWHGLLYDSSLRNRIVTFLVLVVATASLAFTQLGFIGVGVQGNYMGYVIALLVPMALGALMLGILFSTLLGGIAGALLLLHSHFQPLDYYEVTYVTPLTSVALFLVTGFVLGLLFAIALRKNPPVPRRIIYIIIVCVVASVFFTVSFSVNVIIVVIYDIYTMMAEQAVELSDAEINSFATEIVGSMGDTDLQIWLDAAMMAVSCIVFDYSIRRVRSFTGKFSLRTTFRAKLGLVVLTVFMASAAFAFIVITGQAIVSANKEMESEAQYIGDQLETYDQRVQSMNNLLALDAESEKALNDKEVEDLSKVLTIDNLLKGYTKEEDGTIVVFRDGVILLSDDPAYVVGDEAADYVNIPYDHISDKLGSSNEWTVGQMVFNDNAIKLEDTSDMMNYLERPVAYRLVYLGIQDFGDYTVMMIVPNSKVFAGRDSTMAWTTLLSFILLAVVFVLVSRLLGRMVVSRIDETNGVLESITAGDLDAHVDVSDTREFSELSNGINETVGALKGWIAEAESRMDAELATAKAIQESALPRVFPPFPDILKFDIFATMQAAKEVGGDFYDFFLIGDDSDTEAGKLAFVVADVSGKGVPAALFMMKAKTQIRDYLASGMEIGEAIENTNRQLCDGNEAGMFVTAWVGVLDYATGHVEYVNAGHNPPLLWSFKDDGDQDALERHGKKGSWEWVKDKSGMPLGLFDGFPYTAFSTDVLPGGLFLLYSDGVTEAMAVDKTLYGEERLMALANQNTALHPRALVDAIRKDVARHAAGAEQSDDITILALEVGVPPELTVSLVVPADVDELPTVNSFIHTELDSRLCPVRAQKQLDIAVEELFVNVCHYAYPESTPEDPGTVRISYTYSAEPPSVEVSIADEGIPYNPLAKPDAVTPDDIMEVPIGGLGILMAKNSVDDMTYERLDESNVVTIKKTW